MNTTFSIPTASPPTDLNYRPYQPFGGALEILYSKEPEILICGPAGTGKSRAVLEKLHLVSCKYPGSRHLMVRKTRESLTQSGVVTFQKHVLPPNGLVKFRTMEQEFRYSNGSVIVLGGMDKYSKVMSTEYDLIYVQEATELEEEDLEALTTRARFGVVPYNQVIMDCNPSGPYHWLRTRSNAKKCKYIQSFFEDNPKLYNRKKKEWTPEGLAYLAKLDNLSGVRKKRLRFGLWAAAEGMIYDEWDTKSHMINHFDPPRGWPRVWLVDFGFTNPFVWQAWAIDRDNDIAYRFAEIYQTRLLVEDAAAMIKAWMTANHEPRPYAIICDHDAEDRATLERHLDMETSPANKSVSSGIQIVKERLKVRPGILKPRLILMRDSLLERDPELEDAKKPCATEEEIEGYSWSDKRKKDEPIKIDDHGCDLVRYVSSHLDDYYGNWSVGMAR